MISALTTSSSSWSSTKTGSMDGAPGLGTAPCSQLLPRAFAIGLETSRLLSLRSTTHSDNSSLSTTKTIRLSRITTRIMTRTRKPPKPPTPAPLAPPVLAPHLAPSPPVLVPLACLPLPHPHPLPHLPVLLHLPIRREPPLPRTLLTLCLLKYSLPPVTSLLKKRNAAVVRVFAPTAEKQGTSLLSVPRIPPSPRKPRLVPLPPLRCNTGIELPGYPWYIIYIRASYHLALFYPLYRLYVPNRSSLNLGADRSNPHVHE